MLKIVDNGNPLEYAIICSICYASITDYHKPEMYKALEEGHVHVSRKLTEWILKHRPEIKNVLRVARPLT